MLNNLKSKTILIIMGIISVSVATLFFSGCSKQEAEDKDITRPIRVFHIPKDPQQFQQRNFPGRAEATQEVDLSFRVAGPLVEFPVNVGDVVQVGQVVARIDPRDFEVNLNSAQGKLANVQAESRRAQSEYQRELNILKQDSGATSQSAVDRKREQHDKALANIKSFAAAVDTAKDQLEYTFLKAPYTGIVVDTYVENFEDVQAKQRIVRILDDSKIEMIVNIPESLISIASEVKDIKVVFDAFPNVEIPARIKEIGTEASTTTRTFPVNLIMDQPEGVKILPGMAGKASGTPPENMESSTTLSIEIPETSTFTDPASGNTYVWVVDKTALTVSKRQIEISIVGDHGIRVKSGLAADEWIASAGVHYLTEGQKIHILKTSME